MAGWNDNMNGPVGLVAASGKGKTIIKKALLM